MNPTRRTALGASVAGLLAATGLLKSRKAQGAVRLTLRPPGALQPGKFEDACVRCMKCASACPNECIKFYGIKDGWDQAYTPYIKARDRACTLCGECAEVCPTGALKPFEVSREGWKSGVKMGEARVNTAQCYSYAGRTCGACYRACPLAGEALTIGLLETPHIHPDKCVGCGLCEQSCLHIPQAIRVIPLRQKA